MSDKKRILIIGSSYMDMSVNVARFPDKNESLKDEGGISYAPGGVGAMCSVALARLGADTLLSTRLGRDLFGQKLYSFYKEAGVDTSLIKADAILSTGSLLSVKEADGTRRTVKFPGANANYQKNDAIDAFNLSPDALLLSLEGSFSECESLARLAEARGVPIFLDASSLNANMPLERLPELEVFALGEEETKRYTGIMPRGSQETLRALFALRRKLRTKYIVINQGARGAMIYDGKRCDIVSPAVFEKSVDVSGSSEAFSSALSLFYLETGDIKYAVRCALAAAAITSARYGTATALPTREELLSSLNT